MGFKNFALCAFVVCMILPISSQACVDVIQKPGLQCWSSCGLGNCGIVSYDPQAFVRCSWQLNQEGLTRKFNETVLLHFPHYNGEMAYNCEPTDYECNLESGNCIATFYQANCSYIETRVAQAIRAWIPNPPVSMCDVYVHISICTHAKPDRPIVTGISFDQKKNQLLVSRSNETCPSSGLKVYLLYNWTRGNAIEHVVEKMEPYMIYKEATLYNYSLQLTKTGEIKSEPFHGTYITKPKTAVHPESVKLRCLHNGKGHRNVKITWKKYGIIDYFNVTLVDHEDDNIVHTAIINSTSTKQTHYSSTAALKDLSRDYFLLITAYNGGGASKTHRQEIRRNRCQRPPKLSCRVASKGVAWIQVSWEIDRPGLFNFELDFVNPHQTGDHLGSGKLDSEARSWNQTDLKSCVQYKISICADDELLCCKLTEFTKGPGPQVAPSLEDHATTSRNITIKLKHTRMNHSLACGRIKKILVIATSMEKGIFTTKEQSVSERHFKLQNLEPNTKYNISMAAVNDDGKSGINRTIVLKTLEEAPDNPPGINRSSKDSRGFLVVGWDHVESPKGQITHYHLHVNVSEMTKSQDLEKENCKLVDDDYFCIFPATNISAILNIKEAEQVSIRACIGNGTQCSPWSEPVQVVKSDSQVSLMLIILCFLCGVMLLMVTTIGTIYRLKNQGPKPRKPLMHPILQAEFEERLLKGTARKDSIDFEKKV